MQAQNFLILTLVACASAASPQQEQNVAQSNSGVSQNVPIIGNSPVLVQPNVGTSNGVIDVPQPGSIVQSHQHHYQPSVPYYTPAGMITVDQSKPMNRNFEQYGKPESASIPPNYKPFGSWGLYIGGNPADGYYTNYYKALSNSVENQAVVDSQVKPESRQVAYSSPKNSEPGFYQMCSPGMWWCPKTSDDRVQDLNSPGRVDQVSSFTVSHQSPASFDPSYVGLSYADPYATKKVGTAYAQKEVMNKVDSAQPKGYQSRVFYYPAMVAQPMQTNQPQLVAYPVPVGSQIVSSQPDTEGAFSPYGVHAFTRYAIRPAMVSNQDSGYHYNVHNQMPVYKQQYYQAGSSYNPLNFYGYPVNQLHYSQGSIVPSTQSDSMQQGSIYSAPFEPTADKVDKKEKPMNEQQKKA